MPTAELVLPTEVTQPTRRWIDQKFLVLGAAKIGKCMSEGQAVHLANGDVLPVEQLELGMHLLGPDGTPRRITQLYSGQDDLYELQFKHYRPSVVTAKHQLLLHSNIAASGWSKCRIMPVEDFVEHSQFFQQTHGLTRAVAMPYRPMCQLPLEPYFLGLWLGDGHADAPSITTTDPEILAYLRDYAERLGIGVSVYRNPHKTAVDARITDGHKGPKKEGPLALLRSINVLDNKHIPRAYLKAPVYERYQLLAGLIDTDGYRHGNKDTGTNYELTLTNYNLATDVVRLARSLGFASYLAPRLATIKSINYATVAYRVRVIGDCSLIPVRISRKQVRLSKKPPRLLRFTPKPVGKGRYYGFELSDDKLYLDDQYIIHHNSQLFAQGDKTFFIETEAGLGHLAVRKLPCRSWDDLRQIYVLLGQAHNDKAQPFPYDTIVVDTVDRLVAYAHEEAIAWAKRKFKPEVAEQINAIGDIPNGAGWFWVTNLVDNAISKLEVLPAAIVLIGHLANKEIKEPTRSIHKDTISIGGNTGSRLLHWADHTLHIRSRLVGERLQRIVRTRPSETLEAGSRGDVIPDNWKWGEDAAENYRQLRGFFPDAT